jgi:pyruvate,orthophosphate dikinase
MPGMMDTILNLGLNDETVEALARASNNPRFAYDAYRRFIQMFGKIVLSINDKIFSDLLDDIKKEKGVKYDHELDLDALKELVNRFKKVYEQHSVRFPEDPYEQLILAIEAVFRSWMGERAVEYRKYYKITPDIAHGTAVNVVTMVFGNMGDDSGTGVVFTRDPETGEKKIYGEFLRNAQGEDVVAGARTPEHIDRLKEIMPDIYNQLLDICEKLEKHYREPQDVEFTVERGKLYMLQTRAAKMNAPAMVKTSVDMVNEGLIDKKRAIKRINVDQIEQLLHKRADPKSDAKPVAKGIAASPGAATGIAILDTKHALELGDNKDVILVREETKPEDVPAFFKSVGVLTSRGGKTSHAAVVARGMGLPCIVGCSEISIDEESRTFKANNTIVREGDIITIDGTSGNVFLGTIPLIEPEITDEFKQLLAWSEELKRLGIRANADTPQGAKIAREYGAKGIGLCRTERMFNATDRLPIFVRMILADSIDERAKYLAELAKFIKEDAKEILRVMEGYPVTIRLLDPPLHEFLPRLEELDAYSDIPKEQIINRYKELEEVNPMMGHRGVRLGITYPEIYEYQIRAILDATKELLGEGIKAVPQIMVPQVGSVEEFRAIKQIFTKIKGDLDVKFGTMMEVVRACMTADQLAEEAEFFSFGTNDLTQAVFSFSREDVEGKFLPLYLEKGILKDNPFQTLDEGVGKVMDIAVKDGRSINKELEIGICGEHGGDPRSIDLCHRLGLDYVSASPHRIPIAILAAAQSAID